MSATPVPYLKAWVAFLVGTVVFVIPGGALAGLAFFGVASLAGQGENWEFLTWAGSLVQSAAALAVSYVTFRFVIRLFILPAAYSRAKSASQAD